MATITNSIFLADDEGDLRVTVEDAHDPAICRVTLGDAFNANVHIYGTREAYLKLRAAIDEALAQMRNEGVVHCTTT